MWPLFALSSLSKEANHLEQVRATVQKGQNLLEKKAERLTHLESSLVEEVGVSGFIFLSVNTMPMECVLV